MTIWPVGYPEFHRGDKVASLAYHPPEIQSGTEATIVSPQVGSLYVVQLLENGKYHRWLAEFEIIHLTLV